MGKLSVVVGGQFGSEAKGAVAGYLTSFGENNSSKWGERPVVCVRVGGPNAGHTVYGRCPKGCDDAHVKMPGDATMIGSHPWRLRQVPVAAVRNQQAKLVIAAGSEVDFQVLNAEIDQLNSAGYAVCERLYVDKMATVLTKAHIQTEINKNLGGRLGSTAKGIGAARADRIMREALVVGDVVDDGRKISFHTIDTATMLLRELRAGAHVVIEGTQGYGLGLHTRFYPMCTSGNARAIDFLAQAGINPWATYVDKFEVWVVARTRPIRVAGNSGPLKGETSWEDLGLEAEKTTVTQKVRRVGEFDSDLVREAVEANGGSPIVKVALMMVDYEIPNLRGVTDFLEISNSDMNQLTKLVFEVTLAVEANVDLIGTGPTTVIDLRG